MKKEEYEEMSEELLYFSNKIMRENKYKSNGSLSEIARQSLALSQDIDIYQQALKGGEGK